MVLDYDQPSQSGSGFGDDSSVNNDPYFAHNPPNELLRKFPTTITLPPFTFGRRLLHWSQANYENKLSLLICAQLDAASAMMNRPVTQEETNAIVDQASMLSDVPEAAGLLGGTLGVWLGGKPVNVNPKDAEAMTKLSPAARLRASRTAHIAFVLPICFLAGYWISSSIARISVALATARDQRMAQFQKDVTKQNPEEVQRRLKQVRDEAYARRRAAMYGDQPPPQQQRGPPSGDDASPTGGYLESGGSYAQYGSQPNDSKILSDVYSQPNGGFQSQSPPQYPQRPQPPSALEPTQGQSFWDDDASPTNPDVDITPRTATGSTWERIRQSAAARTPPQQHQQQQQQQQQPPSNQEWRSSDYDAGRDSSDNYTQAPRERAQKDFDNLLEREREFGSDRDRDGGNAWQRRW
ncbi:predicted protein [Uncinocarpus reesii 1704]|uniref:Uncharacterized protein n=1 Tax=Uncinocarpus reesii (strain UAMH 1704) TaxID=336963 RepID=C4JQE1_UNCRE|nr:uncharacterized protein UREG_04695 [Uncinocarpus reesii 1704]EEP79849.1 predicted protein [Uncinocarpus reesii 1704]